MASVMAAPRALWLMGGRCCNHHVPPSFAAGRASSGLRPSPIPETAPALPPCRRPEITYDLLQTLRRCAENRWSYSPRRNHLHNRPTWSVFHLRRWNGSGPKAPKTWSNSNPTPPHIFATGSDHYIQINQPDLVI